MVKMGLRRLALMALLASLVIGAVWTSGCTTSEENGDSGQQAPTQTFVDVTPQEAFTLIQENEGNPDFVILDIRTPEEFDEGHIAGAIMIDFYSMSFRIDLDKLDKDKTYLLYCRTGNRTGQTIPTMEELGFQEVYHLVDGIVAWKEAMMPVTGANG